MSTKSLFFTETHHLFIHFFWDALIFSLHLPAMVKMPKSWHGIGSCWTKRIETILLPILLPQWQKRKHHSFFQFFFMPFSINSSVIITKNWWMTEKKKKNTDWKPKEQRRQATWKHPHNQELVLGQRINLGTVQAWHIYSTSLNKFTKLNLTILKKWIIPKRWKCKIKFSSYFHLPVYQ